MINRFRYSENEKCALSEAGSFVGASLVKPEKARSGKTVLVLNRMAKACECSIVEHIFVIAGFTSAAPTFKLLGTELRNKDSLPDAGIFVSND